MKNIVVALFAFALSCTAAHAQKSEVYVKKGYAANGYDVVAYFTQKQPVEGKKTFLYQWHDAYWLFSTKENLEAFSKDPEKYAPQFGGYCAYGVSQGHKAPTQPDAWTIINEKLYLNYDTGVRKLWQKDIDGNIEKGKVNWQQIKDKK